MANFLKTPQIRLLKNIYKDSQVNIITSFDVTSPKLDFVCENFTVENVYRFIDTPPSSAIPKECVLHGDYIIFIPKQFLSYSHEKSRDCFYIILRHRGFAYMGTYNEVKDCDLSNMLFLDASDSISVLIAQDVTIL